MSEGVGVTIIGRYGRSSVSWVTRCGIGTRERRLGISHVTHVWKSDRLEQPIETFVERYRLII